jgi:hypothetical protein
MHLVRSLLVLFAFGGVAYALWLAIGDNRSCQPAAIGTILVMATCAK